MKLCLVCNFQFEDEQELCPKDLSKLVPVGKDPLIGKLIQDKYRVENLVAKGSMGTIYRAVQEVIRREVAIKVMHSYLVSDEESLKRYHKEAKASSRLNHPNITTIYDFGVLASGQPYIVMDLLQGKSLSEVIRERGQLTVKQTLMVFQQTCMAIAEAHKQSVVHRDIKPENIVIDELPDRKNIQVKVVDFGIATFAADVNDTLGKITKTGTVCGSPFYMSPEQCDASGVDARSDLYSLGIVLFECLTGRVPFEAKDVYKVLTMQVNEPAPELRKARPDLNFSKELEAVVAKSLSKPPTSRFQSAEEFWLALAKAGEAKPGSDQFSTDAATPAQQAPKPSGQSQTKPGAQANLPNETIPALSIDQRNRLEDLNKKMKAATLSMNGQPDLVAQRSKIRKTSVSTIDRLIGIIQMLMPPLLTLAVTAILCWVLANESLLHALIAKKYGHSAFPSKASDDISTLLTQGKLEQAQQALEKKKKSGSFNDRDLENLNAVYILLARKEEKARHFKQAMNFLEQVSPAQQQQKEVKVMLKRLKKQALK